MQASARRVLIDELKTAYAMERQASDMLGTMRDRFADVPELSRRFGEHLGETRRQLDRLSEALRTLDAEPSPIRDAGQRLIGGLQMVLHASSDSELLRSMYASFAFEGQEIATYRGLVAMARHAGEEAIADLCQQSLVEEQDMALFLEDKLDEVAVRYMQKAAARLDQKR